MGFRVRGWATHPHRAKPRSAKLSSYGLSFLRLGLAEPPYELVLSFEDTDGKQMTIHCDPEQVTELRDAANSFLERLGKTLP